MPLTLTRTVEPAEEPVTLAEAKAHLRVDDTTEDAYISALITAARVHAESHTERQFITATYQLRLDEFPRRCSDIVRLPRPLLIAVSAIAYTDEDGVAQTLDPSLYQVDAASLPGRVMPAYGAVWPTTQEILNAVTITFTAGYGAAAAVPLPIKHAIKLLASHWFENREPVVVGTITSEVPMTVKALLGPYRVGTVY
jgi:uncharacterized phiE125 gp8 family phage protein